MFEGPFECKSIYLVEHVVILRSFVVVVVNLLEHGFLIWFLTLSIRKEHSDVGIHLHECLVDES